jgi:hypothetical protein
MCRADVPWGKGGLRIINWSCLELPSDDTTTIMHFELHPRVLQ